MDKLTLEHLAPYLPYGVELAFIVRNEVRYIDKITGISGIGDYDDIKIKLGYNDSEHIWMFKPILRPMSDFDKMDNEFDLTTDFETAYVTNRNDIAFINTSDKTYLSDIKTVVKFLFENKFDVFGLIEKGLAVDINQIDNLNLSNNYSNLNKIKIRLLFTFEG